MDPYSCQWNRLIKANVAIKCAHDMIYVWMQQDTLKSDVVSSRQREGENSYFWIHLVKVKKSSIYNSTHKRGNRRPLSLLQQCQPSQHDATSPTESTLTKLQWVPHHAFTPRQLEHGKWFHLTLPVLMILGSWSNLEREASTIFQRRWSKYSLHL